MKKIYFVFILGILLISNCKKIEGPEGKTSLMNLIVEPGGINCINGGYKIITGIDLNRNGVLDADEVQNTNFICNGINAGYDKEIILLLGGFLGSNSGPVVEPLELPYFDKTNYVGIDSIILAVENIKTSDYFFNDIIGSGTFELYNMTNNSVIANSSIVSDDIPENTSKYSGNLYKYLPNNKIKLGIRITSGGDFNASCGNIYLIMVRK